MDQVESMSLSMNNVSGPLPKNWTTMATNALQGLWLHGNALSGVVPPSWGHLMWLSISGSLSINKSLDGLPANINTMDMEMDVDCPSMLSESNFT